MIDSLGVKFAIKVINKAFLGLLNFDHFINFYKNLLKLYLCILIIFFCPLKGFIKFIIEFNLGLFNDVKNVIFLIRLEILIKFKKHLFKLKQTDKLMFAMELINTCETT